MSLLSRWLTKLGVEKVDDLSSDEKQLYDHYKAILSGETLSVESIKEFCQQQIRIIEGSCDGKTPLTDLQQACLHVYLNIVKAIEAPEAERLRLEQYLTQVITSP